MIWVELNELLVHLSNELNMSRCKHSFADKNMNTYMHKSCSWRAWSNAWTRVWRLACTSGHYLSLPIFPHSSLGPLTDKIFRFLPTPIISRCYLASVSLHLMRCCSPPFPIPRRSPPPCPAARLPHAPRSPRPCAATCLAQAQPLSVSLPHVTPMPLASPSVPSLSLSLFLPPSLSLSLSLSLPLSLSVFLAAFSLPLSLFFEGPVFR